MYEYEVIPEEAIVAIDKEVSPGPSSLYSWKIVDGAPTIGLISDGFEPPAGYELHEGVMFDPVEGKFYRNPTELEIQALRSLRKVAVETVRILQSKKG